MKCPHCNELIEKMRVIEGQYVSESVNDSRIEKVHVKSAGVFICPKCDTIIGINSQIG